MPPHSKRHAKARRQGSPVLPEQTLKNLGQRVSAAVHATQSASGVVLAADVAITTSAWVNVTGLEAPVIAGRVYWFRARMVYTHSSSSGFSAWSVSGPASPTRLNYYVLQPNGSSNFNIDQDVAYDGTDFGALCPAQSGSFAIIEGVIVPSVDGTLVVRGFGQSGSTVTALAGSTLEVT